MPNSASLTDVVDLGPNWTTRRQAQRDYVASLRKEIPPKSFYNFRLFKIMQGRRIGSNVSRLGVREIAQETNLSVQTVTDALNGKAKQIATLWKLARYFDIPWTLLFDLNASIPYEITEDATTGFYRIVVAGSTTPDPASPPAKSKIAEGRDFVKGSVANAIGKKKKPAVGRGGAMPGSSGIYGKSKVKK